MPEFDNVLYVWCGGPDSVPSNKKLTDGLLGMTTLPYALGCHAVHWKQLETMDLSKYDLFLVVMFGLGETPISTIKSERPGGVVLALPDPPPEHLFYPPNWGERHRVLLNELKQADYIGDRFVQQGAFTWTEALTGIPPITFPGPFAPTEQWEMLRQEANSQGYIGSLAHLGWEPHYNAATMFALKAAQEVTGLPIRMVQADDVCRDIAATLGLDIEFLDRLSAVEFARFVGNAELFVDLYPMSSMGRAGLIAGYFGVLSVSSKTTESMPGHLAIDKLWNYGDIKAAINRYWRHSMPGHLAIDKLWNYGDIKAAINRYWKHDAKRASIAMAHGELYIEEYYSERAAKERTRQALKLPVRNFGNMPLHKIAAYNTPEALNAFWDSDYVRSGEYFNGRWGFYEHIASIIKSLVRDGDTLLDVGCGVGPLVKVLLDRGIVPAGSITGIDSSSVAIEQAQKSYPGCVFNVQDAYGIESAYDIVTCLEVLEHQIDPGSFLAELIDSVNIGGNAIITVPYGPDDQTLAHRHRWDEQGFLALLQGHVQREGQVTVTRYGNYLIGLVEMG